MTATTVVTCLFDLASREPASNRRTVAQYLDFAEVLLALDVDLVCFTEPSIEPSIRARREDHGLGHRTDLVTGTLESLPSYERLELAVSARDSHPLLNGNPMKDTPLYTVLTWSKFDFLERAMRSNPFGASHFAWLDLGFGHMAKTDHLRDDGVFDTTPDAVRVLQMRPLDPAVVEDRAHFLSYRRGYCAGTLISGGADALRRLCVIVERELRDALRDGFAPNDEQLLELAAVRQPELFSFHHGDYDHVTENYHRLRGSAVNLLFQLRCWRVAEQWKPAARLAKQIVNAVAGGVFQADPPEVARLLEECFLVTYYADPDQTDAREAASLYADLAHRDSSFRDEFLLHEIRVRTNFSFLTDVVVI